MHDGLLGDYIHKARDVFHRAACTQANFCSCLVEIGGAFSLVEVAILSGGWVDHVGRKAVGDCFDFLGKDFSFVVS